MLTKTLELKLPGRISDGVCIRDRVVAALDSGLAIVENGALARTIDIPVRSIVPSNDGMVLLAVSDNIKVVPHIPWSRRIHRVMAPFVLGEDLGIVRVDDFSPSFDGRYWPTFAGDDVHLFEVSDGKLNIVAHYETFLPVKIESTPEGIWLELSSIGAQHFEVLSVPDLQVVNRGDLICSNIQFPPEMIPLNAWSPTLAKPITAVHARGLPFGQDDENNLILYPIRNVDRLIIPNGPVITSLPAPAAGLVASGTRALCWCPIADGMELIGVCLEKAQVTSRFVIEGATDIGARIVERDMLIWEGNTIRVFRDAL